MELGYSVLRLPKQGSTPEQCEDAAAYSRESCIAAVSDGASSAFESGLWARLLAVSFVSRPPPGPNPAQILDWVEMVAAEWSAAMSAQPLSIFEEAKVTSEGSAATLVGVHFEESASEPGEGRWQCLAMGDSCLFRIAEGNLAEAVPLTESKQFSQRTPLFYTRRDLSERDMASLATPSGRWHDGDRFLLLTDKIAEWFLREAEHGGKPWDVLASLDQSSFGSFVAEGRSLKLIRDDDVTVVMLEPRAARAIRPPRPRGGHRGRRRRSPGRPARGVRPVASGPAPAPRDPMPRDPMPRDPMPRDAVPRDAAPTRPEPGRSPARPPTQGRPTQGPPTQGPPTQAQRIRRLAGVLTAVLSVGLIVGILIGWVVWHGRSSSPSPVVTLRPTPASTTSGPPPSPTAAIQAAARRFVLALVSYDGDLSAYESSLRPLGTPGLDASLPGLLGLGSPNAGSVDSSGQVISTALASATNSTAVLYLVVDQTLATGPAYQSHRQVLLIRLEMARAGANWQASKVELITSAGQMLPRSAQSTGTGGT